MTTLEQGGFFFLKSKVTHRLYRGSLLLQHSSPLLARASLFSSTFTSSPETCARRPLNREALPPCLCSTHHGYSRDLHPLHRRISAVRRTRKVSSQLGRRRSCCIQPVCLCLCVRAGTFLCRCSNARSPQRWLRRRGAVINGGDLEDHLSSCRLRLLFALLRLVFSR